MTLPDLDAAVVEAERAVLDIATERAPAGGPSIEYGIEYLRRLGAAANALRAARTAADRPQPLTAEEAKNLWGSMPLTDGCEDWQAVLDACRARDLKVAGTALRALLADPAPVRGGPFTVEYDKVMDAIRSALLPPAPLTRR